MLQMFSAMVGVARASRQAMNSSLGRIVSCQGVVTDSNNSHRGVGRREKLKWNGHPEVPLSHAISGRKNVLEGRHCRL